LFILATIPYGMKMTGISGFFGGAGEIFG